MYMAALHSGYKHLTVSRYHELFFWLLTWWYLALNTHVMDSICFYYFLLLLLLSDSFALQPGDKSYSLISRLVYIIMVKYLFA